jgi:hypothetical protein
MDRGLAHRKASTHTTKHDTEKRGQTSTPRKEFEPTT